MVAPVKGFQTNVNVNAAPTARAALGTGLAKRPKKLLERFNVSVVQNGRYQFALLVLRPSNGNVLGELPLTALRVPRAPRHIAVNAGGVPIALGSEEISGDLGGALPADVVHFDLHAEGLCFHSILESDCLSLHGVSPFVPFGAVGAVLHLMMLL